MDLASERGLESALRWYIATAAERFNASGFRNLELWGFYWMREEISPYDEARLQLVSRTVHESGFRFLWIPWWKAPGWDRWRLLGFDAAIMQPNYAFVSSTHGGSVRRNRLAVAADLCRSQGMGVEMEAGDLIRSRADREAFLEYLADGAPSRLGYRQGACAWYLGGDMVEQTAASREPAVRACYEALADFIQGLPVRDPNAPQEWRALSGGFLGRLRTPAEMSRLDLFFDEPLWVGVWQGRVEVQRRSGPNWQTLGWALRTHRDPAAGRHQVITVPVEARVREVRVILHRHSGPAKLARPRLVLNNVGPEGVHKHAAIGCLYTTDLSANRTYDDDGGKLTDGIVPAGGFVEKRSVGWFAPRAAVVVDLGSIQRVTEVHLACQGGSYGAVNWPSSAVAFLSANGIPPRRLSGTGSWPERCRWVMARPVEVTRQRSDTDLDGLLRFPVDPPALARYVSVVLGGNGWIMLSELRVLDGTRNLTTDRGVSYRLQPLPSVAHDAPQRYADDGERLTDGVVAQAFIPHQLVGWDDGRPHTVTLDLGSDQRIDSVTVWSLRGGQASIYAPRDAHLELSKDGHAWAEAGASSWQREAEDGKTCVAAPCTIRLSQPATARYARLRVTPSGGWCMLSEMEVRAAPLR